MHEHEPRIGVHLQQFTKRIDVIRPFKNPTARTVLVLQILQEALVKAIGLEMP
jgi:hypothetical protein